MPDSLASINLRKTPSRTRANPREVKNNAEGYVYEVKPIDRIRRFLVLGTDGGTYYTGEQELTQQNATEVMEWARHSTRELVDVVVELSTMGRAPKQNPCIFALAAAAALGEKVEDRQYASDRLPLVARTGTHLFLFVKYSEQFRGWGRGLKRAVGDWYLNKDVDKVAYQAVKYREREGWSHRDLLRKAHPKTDEADRKALFAWMANKPSEDLPAIVDAFQRAQHLTTAEDFVSLIQEGSGLSWEMLPDIALGQAKVWEALLHRGVPQTALMRQLPRLTRLGLLKPMSETLRLVGDQLTNANEIKRARLHPINILVALRTYASGESARGSSTWIPETAVINALDEAFYTSFGTITPANKRTLIALDVSGSMGFGAISGLPLTPREAAAALALVTAATEKQYYVMAFSRGFVPLNISPRQRLDDVLRTTNGLPFDYTDCAVPMVSALKNKVEVDTFEVITDNEHWYGEIHPDQALRQYRDKMGIDARLVVVGMTATNFTITDPNDPGSLDVAGFDSAVPQLISDFSARAI